jgi:hypothetical protein
MIRHRTSGALVGTVQATVRQCPRGGAWRNWPGPWRHSTSAGAMPGRRPPP